MNYPGEYIIRNALHNLLEDSGASDDYRRGIVVGVVAGIMGAKNCAFDTAWNQVKFLSQTGYLPIGLDRLMKYAPETWRECL